MNQTTVMPKISAVIITYNEESYIDRCLASLEGVADEIVVVDSFSTDRTEEICRKYDVNFVTHKFEGYKDQKNYALKLAAHRNILSMDADEALSDTLRKSVLEVKQNWKHDGYYFKRRNYFCGKWIRHSAWYPDKQLRLFYSDMGEFGELNLHEKFIMSNGSKIPTLKGDLLHWPVESYEDYFNKMNNYTLLGAKEFHKAGKKASIITPYIHSVWGFIRSYLIRGGFLDGHDGFLICSSHSKSTFHKYTKLREFNKNGFSQKSY